MSVPRFYLPPGDWDGDVVSLPPEEAKHCTEVLRQKQGGAIVVFDGEGREATGRITEASRRVVNLELGEIRRIPRPSARLVLAQAIPKGKTMDLVIQKATELGVAVIFPLLTEHTVVKLDPRDLEKKRERWQRTALEACKQCGQNWLPEVVAPCGMPELFASSHLEESDLKLIASLQSGARHLKEVLEGNRPASALVLVGPEGDFTEEEVATSIAKGCQPLDLGPIVLRAETAAIYCLSILGHELF